MSRLPRVLLLLAVVLPLVALSVCDVAKAYDYTAPERTDDGWEVGTLSDEHVDENLAKDLFERINDKTYPNIHSVLVVKGGKLIVEEYFPGQDSGGTPHEFGRDTLHEIQSATKSVNSILIGIAIDQKLISGVDEKLSALLPAYADIFTGSEKDAIRLRDLLTMTAGLSWDEWTYPYTDARNDHVAMNASPDPVRYVLERPLVTKPGTKFVYSSGISIVLGEIVRKVSGLAADKFAEQHLFGPLGIANYYWYKYPNGVVQTGGGLLLRPRDMAKIGSLYLNGGRWQGKQVVSEEWVRAATKNCVESRQIPLATMAEGYGYQWWLRSFQGGEHVIESFHAAGRGGQFICVVPELDLVAVFTGWNDNALITQPLDMLRRYILPAVGPGDMELNQEREIK